MLSAPTTYDPELEREAYEDFVAEQRDKAIDTYLDRLASMSARDWTRMLTHFETPPTPWADDDEFCRLVGELAKESFEKGLGM